MQLINRQFEHIDNAPLILFRVAFGMLVMAESIGAIFTGWVKKAFIEPTFNFTTIGLEFLQPLEGNGMYYYFIIMGLCGLFIAIGFYYRISLSIFTILWAIVYSMQKSFYNNHYYLLILLCVFMLLVPANAYFSIDAKRRAKIRSFSCQRWHINIFILQLLIVYTFAALHKFYPGWLDGDFIRITFAAKSSYPLIGQWLQDPFLQKIIIYGGILFDGTIIILLLIPQTRKVAFGISVAFHLFNSIVFQIGIFPYLMLASSVFFFPPQQIRNIFFKKKPLPSNALRGTTLKKAEIGMATLLIMYFLVQLYLPLRHHLYEGNVFYTEEGHRLSWRMMLRLKSGQLSYKVVSEKNDSSWIVQPRDYLTRKQTLSIVSKPDMIWQFAQYLEKQYQNEGIGELHIYANSTARLNYGPSYTLIDPSVDLTSVEWERLKHSSWILEPK